MGLAGFIGSGDFVTPIEAIVALIVWFSIKRGENYQALVPIFMLYLLTGVIEFLVSNAPDDYINLAHISRALTTVAFIGTETNRETVIFLLALNAVVLFIEKYALKRKTNYWFYFFPLIILIWLIPFNLSFGLLNPILEPIFHEVPETLSYIGTFIQSGILSAVLMICGFLLYKPQILRKEASTK